MKWGGPGLVEIPGKENYEDIYDNGIGQSWQKKVVVLE